MKKNRWKVKGKDVVTAGDWIEVKEMFKYEHRFMEMTSDFLLWLHQVSGIFKHLAGGILKLSSRLEKLQ